MIKTILAFIGLITVIIFFLVFIVCLAVILPDKIEDYRRQKNHLNIHVDKTKWKDW